MRRRRSLAAVAALAVALAVWLIAAAGGPEPEWLAVERGPLVLGAEVTGALRAVHSDLLGPPLVSGQWNYKLAFLVPEGTRVEPGQPVMRFDTSELERQQLEKAAARDAAEKELEKKRNEIAGSLRDADLRLAEAAATLRRAELQNAVPAELVGANELAEARIDLELARTRLAHQQTRRELLERQGRAELAALTEKRDRAAERVEEIGDSIGKMTVAAPRAGTVIYYTGRRGEKKKAGDSVWQREQVLEIPDLTQMMAEGEIDEADAGRVAPGQPVSLRLDAHPDRIFRGRVRSIHDTVERRSVAVPVKVVRLEIELDETDPMRMRPGMRFSGKVELERLEDALLAPAAAVFGSPGGPVTFRRTLFGVETVRPTLGRYGEDAVEVLSGLAEGDRLAAQPPRDWEAEG